MTAIFQTAFSNAFSWMPARQQAIIWTNDGLLTDAYMRHSASMS